MDFSRARRAAWASAHFCGLALQYPPMGNRFAALFAAAALFALAFAAPAASQADAASVRRIDLPSGAPFKNVAITLDSYGVPHITAPSLDACFFGAGYMHAYHRLVQLDVTRRLGRGELAGWAGEERLESDRLMRRLRLGAVADASLELLKPDEIAALSAYTEGVNFYISHCAQLPMEFALTGPPRKWTNSDSLVCARVMSWMLMEDYFTTIDNEYRRPKTDPALLKLVDLSPLEGIAYHISPDDLAYLHRTGYEAQDLKIIPGEAPSPGLGSFEPDSTLRGSNCFVISGKLTEDGLPVIASDPHLDLTYPPIWYEMRLTAPDYDARGMTVPGVPAIVIGATNDIAWGITALGGDNADAIRYQVRNAASPSPDISVESLQSGELSAILGGDGWRIADKEYLTRNGWKRFLARDESFEITDMKGRRTKTETVLYTEAGPVMFKEEGGSVIVLKWVGMFPDREGAAFLAMNKAKNIDEFRSAIRELTTSQNLIYCDKDGNIAYFPTGKYPKRKYDGAAPVSGESQSVEWPEWITTDELPVSRVAQSGFIVSANQAIGPEYKVDLSGGGLTIGKFTWDLELGGYRSYGHRAKRIGDLIEEAKSRGKISRLDVARIQCDTYSQLGAGFRDFVIETLDAADYAPGAADNPARVAYDMLKNWDGYCSTDSAGAAVAYLMLANVSDRLLRSRGWGSTSERVWHGGLDYGRNLGALWDDPKTEQIEDAPAILADALEYAASTLEKKFGPDAPWRWDKMHLMDLTYPVPFIGMYAPGLVPSPGGNDTVWQGASSLNSDGAFVQDFGPSMRVIMSPGCLDDDYSSNAAGNAAGGAYFLSVLPGGQSGDPRDPNGKDQLALYLAGGYK